MKVLTCQKQYQEAMCRASKHHATGRYHSKQRHAMILLNASLSGHQPKRHRRYDGTHVNIASFINSFRLGRKTKHGINRIMIATLQAQTTHHKALHEKTSIPTVIRHVPEAKHGKIKLIGCMDH